VSEFYGKTAIVLVGESALDIIAPLLPEGICLLTLSADGLINGEDPKTEDASGTVPLIGMGVGLLSLFVTEEERAAAVSLIDHAKQHGMRLLPEICEIDIHADKTVSREAAMKVLVRALFSRFESETKFAGNTLRQLNAIRGEHERQALNYERARKLVTELGSHVRKLQIDLAPGTEVLKVRKGQDVAEFAQYLPADLVSINAIWLHVSREARRARGYVILSVECAGSRLRLAERQIPYSDLAEGWCRFELPVSLESVWGDALLTVQLVGAGGPAFSFSDIVAVRFGDEDGKSLALRLETYLAGLLEDAETGQPLVNVRSRLPRVSGIGLVDRLKIVGGDQALQEISSELQEPAVSAEAEAGNWLQLRAREERPVAVFIPKLVPSTANDIVLEVEHGHREGALCRIVAVRYPAEKSPVEILGSIVSKNGDLVDAGMCDTTGAIWSAALLSCGQKKQLTVSKPAEEGTVSSLMLVALTAGAGDIDASCRINWVDIYIKPPNGISLSKPAYSPNAALSQMYYKIPELAGQVKFYQGEAALDKISRRLGYSPFLLKEGSGVLQTHPYENSPSAGLIEGICPPRARRISSEVSTAHAAANSFTYVMGIIPAGHRNRADLIDHIFEQVRGGEFRHVDSKTGVEWVARTLPPLKTYMLDLEIQNVSDQPCDVFIGAVSLGDAASYAWCRWYSVSVTCAEGSPGLNTYLNPVQVEGA